MSAVVFGLLCLFIENGTISGGVAVYSTHSSLLRHAHVLCLTSFVHQLRAA